MTFTNLCYSKILFYQRGMTMPLIHIYHQEGKSDAELQIIGDVIHEVLMETWNIPLNDRFHIFHEKKKVQFDMNREMWGVKRSDDLLVLHITSSPRSDEMKLDFYKRLPEVLQKKAKIKPDDVFISLVCNEKIDWSFGMGKAQLLE